MSSRSLEYERSWPRFQADYQRKFGKYLGKADEPSSIVQGGPEAVSEVLRAREPDNLSRSDFVEDRLSSLVRIAIEQGKISLNRGAEMRRLAYSLVNIHSGRFSRISLANPTLSAAESRRTWEAPMRVLCTTPAWS